MELLHTAESRRQVKLILVVVVTVGELSLACTYLVEESYGGHFLHTISTFPRLSEEGFAIPPELHSGLGETLLLPMG